MVIKTVDSSTQVRVAGILGTRPVDFGITQGRNKHRSSLGVS